MINENKLPKFGKKNVGLKTIRDISKMFYNVIICFNIFSFRIFFQREIFSFFKFSNKMNAHIVQI